MSKYSLYDDCPQCKNRDIHYKCIRSYFEQSNQYKCPKCRYELTDVEVLKIAKRFDISSILNRRDPDTHQNGLRSLVEDEPFDIWRIYYRSMEQRPFIDG